MVTEGEGQARQVSELPLDADLVILRRPIAGGYQPSQLRTPTKRKTCPTPHMIPDAPEAPEAIASANAILQLLFMPAYPFWSLCLFTLDMLVIYGLIVQDDSAP